LIALHINQKEKMEEALNGGNEVAWNRQNKKD
jgi:hypothetical protein